MKKLLAIALMFITGLVYPQYYQEWSEPLPLTDSVSFNSHPAIAVTPDFGLSQLYLFYEKQFTMDSPKQIWVKKISEPMGVETVVFANDTFIYRNPMVIGSNFLIFESNVHGNFDILGIKFDEFGNFDEPFQLTNTPADEKSFFGRAKYGTPYCCWEYNGKILASDLIYTSDTLQFSEIDTIDTGNCHDPVRTDNYIAWRKIEDNESHVYSSSKGWPLFQWSDPDTVFTKGNNINLSIADANADEGWIICWENADSIIFMNIDYNPELISPDFNGIDSYHQPSAFNMYIIVDYFPELYSFNGNSGNQSDIYIVDIMYSLDPINVSNDLENNSNPKLFCGRHFPYSFEVLNIWQTHENGYEVLYKSDANYLWGATAETNSNNNQLSLSVSPCPFYRDLKVNFYLPENFQFALDIYNMQGNLIKRMLSTSASRGFQSLHWVPLNDGINLSEGVYFVKLTQGKSSIVQKVVYSR